MALPSPPPSQDFFSPARGPNAHLFLPPKSPVSISAIPTYATSADYFSYGNGGRKRARLDSSHGNSQADVLTPAWPRGEDAVAGSVDLSSSGVGASTAHVNERYTLAGGFDTPGLLAHATWETPIEQDIDARRRLVPRTSSYSHSATITGALARERNGVARTHSSPNGQSQSWTRFAFGLVGKAFTFGTTVFTGFIAGGGRTYTMSDSSFRALGMPGLSQEQASTPLPGSWRSDEFLGDFEQDNPMSPPSSALARPAIKRRQTDRDSWVVVNTPELSESTSPKRKTASRPSLASRAPSRRSTLAAPVRRQSSTTSHTGSPARLATTARPSSRHGLGGAAELSPDAEKLVKKRAREEKAAERVMGSMSRRMEALIRQGQQALGTRVDVEGAGMDDDDMEGW
ncbi:hypothetical protein B0A48_09184 [Cryoendolithus antarcticus]|uniref:Uncharacterized protein n=1 Tax=Cryoendolithus antarcticus TaxID=1507870 RepID=A0A1V8T1X8_9PEZI|nr:hypothetical protein B0A48_09184 [Cryoendolithus antarcticus]